MPIVPYLCILISVILLLPFLELQTCTKILFLCLFLLHSSLLVLIMCIILSLNSPAFVDFSLKYRDPKQNGPADPKHRTQRPFFLSHWLDESFLSTAQVIPACLLPSPLGNIFMMKRPLSPNPHSPCCSASH